MDTRRASRRTVLTALCGLFVGSTTNDDGTADDDEAADHGRFEGGDDGPTIGDTEGRSWRAQTGVSGSTLVEGVAVVATEGGELLSLAGAEDEERSSVAVAAEVVDPPATGGEAVSVAAEEDLVAVDADTGDER